MEMGMNSCEFKAWALAALIPVIACEANPDGSQGSAAPASESAGNSESGAGDSESPSQGESAGGSQDGGNTGASGAEATAGPTGEGESGSGDGATGTTGPEIPEGWCYDGDHDGLYPCECSEGEEMTCDDGTQVCIVKDYEVYTSSYWSECLECVPGTSRPCTTAAEEPGVQFCNVNSVAELDERWGANWGTCLLEADLVCDPILDTGCLVPGVQCVVDGDGVPGCQQ
jgi:hypothetical protein